MANKKQIDHLSGYPKHPKYFLLCQSRNKLPKNFNLRHFASILFLMGSNSNIFYYKTARIQTLLGILAPQIHSKVFHNLQEGRAMLHHKLSIDKTKCPSDNSSSNYRILELHKILSSLLKMGLFEDSKRDSSTKGNN